MTESDDKAWVGNPALWLNEHYLYPDKEKVDELWRPEPGESVHQKYFIDEDYVAVVSPECAIYVFKGSFAGVDEEGLIQEKVPMTGSYVFVLRDGEWKWLHFHQSWEND